MCVLIRQRIFEILLHPEIDTLNHSTLTLVEVLMNLKCKARQAFLYSTYHTQGNSKCFTEALKCIKIIIKARH